MAYSDFNLSRIKKEFAVKITEKAYLFGNIEPIEPSEYLKITLAETVPLALAINTEKARFELIITPILLEIRRKLSEKISLFSGIDFNVDQDKGLTGYCDFIISKSPEQLIIDVPIAVIVEAKNENINQGIGQCIAEMLAAQMYNEKEGNKIKTIYGVVTTGDIWRFLSLEKEEIKIDLTNIYLENIGQILGILISALTNNK